MGDGDGVLSAIAEICFYLIQRNFGNIPTTSKPISGRDGLAVKTRALQKLLKWLKMQRKYKWKLAANLVDSVDNFS